MQWLASLCIRQPVLTWVLMLVFIVIGTFGYFSLGVDQFPKIDFPAVVVTTTENGAAPEEIETPQSRRHLVTKPRARYSEGPFAAA